MSGQVKPTGIPNIDWTNPITAGLIFYGFDTGSGIVDLTGLNPPLSATNTLLGQATAYGTALYHDGGASPTWTPGAAVPAAWAGSYTIASAWLPGTMTVNHRVTAFGLAAGAGGQPHYNGSVYFNETEQLSRIYQPWIGYSNPGGFFFGAWGSPSPYPSANQYHSLTVTTDNTTGHVYYDGVQPVGGTGPVVTGYSASSPFFMFGDANYRGFVFFGAIWNRVLTAAEALSLHENPYSFLLPGNSASASQVLGLARSEAGAILVSAFALQNVAAFANQGGNAAGPGNADQLIPPFVNFARGRTNFCLNCFFRRGAPGVLTCHRSAPTAQDQPTPYKATWLPVGDMQWCGQHARTDPGVYHGVPQPPGGECVNCFYGFGPPGGFACQWIAPSSFANFAVTGFRAGWLPVDDGEWCGQYSASDPNIYAVD